MQNRLHRLSSFALCLVVIPFSQGVRAAGVPAEPLDGSATNYRSNASEVRLVFFATDPNNHPVENLQQDDFAVIDNEEIIRDFLSFTGAPLLRLDVVVLMDTSQSVLVHFRQEAADVLQLISQWPLRPGDAISVFSFNDLGTHLICTADCALTLTPAQIASAARGGPTPLYDAIAIGTNELVQQTQSDVWPLIILFSDGDDTISKVSFGEVMKPILARGVQIYSIDIGGAKGSSRGSAVLQRMAQDSGGRYLVQADGALATLHAIISDLHSARIVTYALPESGSDFHSVRILPTRNLNLQFHSRRGYYVQSHTH